MNWKRWLWRIGVLLGALGIGFWLGQCSGGSATSNSSDIQGPPVAHVTLAPLVRKTISATVTAYGSVITQPGKNHAVSVPYETRVQHVLVAPGESVTAGQPLVQIDPSPQTKLKLAQAQSAAQAAQKEFQQTQQKFNLKLATNQELGLAKKNAENATLQLQTLKKQGASKEREVQAEMAGLVGKVDVQDGQIVQAGSPLVELVVQNEIEVRLGAEPEDVKHLQLGQTVALYQVHLTNASRSRARCGSSPSGSIRARIWSMFMFLYLTSLTFCSIPISRPSSRRDLTRLWSLREAQSCRRGTSTFSIRSRTTKPSATRCG